MFPIVNKVLTKQISAAQRRVEGINFDVRKTLLGYDDVLRQQREIMYEQRDYILENEDVHTVVKEMFTRVVSNAIAGHRDMESKDHSVDIQGLVEGLEKLGLVSDVVNPQALSNLSVEEMEGFIVDDAWSRYEDKIKEVKDQFTRIEKDMSLRMIDRSWIDHIDAMSKLREGIPLRSYAQEKPLQAYVEEGYEMFDDMLNQIAQDIVMFCINVKIEYRQG